MQHHKNHHYVSKVHLKNFFNTVEKKIYVYDKQLNRLYSKNSTRTLFSEENLNSRYKDGEFDHNTLEDELNEYFEKDFNIHYKTIESYVKERLARIRVIDAIVFMAKYGIVGELRVPRFKKLLDDSLFGMLAELTANATSKLKKEFDELQEDKNKIKYSNLTGYSDIANGMVKKMGTLIFKILTPTEENDYFVIPDICSATVRDKINSYFNPDVEEVAFISLALSSKIYLVIYSSKLKGCNKSSGIKAISSNEVFDLNSANYDYCDSKVACENQSFLKRFAEKMNSLK